MRNSSTLSGDERHHHLHRLHLSVRLAGDDFASVILQETNELSGDIGAELRRIELIR